VGLVYLAAYKHTGSKLGQMVGLYINTTHLGFGFLFCYYNYLGVQSKFIFVNEDRCSLMIPVMTICASRRELISAEWIILRFINILCCVRYLDSH